MQYVAGGGCAYVHGIEKNLEKKMDEASMKGMALLQELKQHP